MTDTQTIAYIEGYFCKEAKDPSKLWGVLTKLLRGGKAAPTPTSALPQISMVGKAPKVGGSSILTNPKTWNIALPAVGGTAGGIHGYGESGGDPLATGLAALGGATTASPAYWKTLAKGKILGDPTISMGTGLLTSAGTLSAPHTIPKIKDSYNTLLQTIEDVGSTASKAESSVGDIGGMTVGLSEGIPQITEAATKASEHGAAVSEAIANMAEKGIPVTGLDQAVSQAIADISQKGIPVVGLDHAVSQAANEIGASLEPTTKSVQQLSQQSEALIKKLDTLVDEAKAGKEEAKSKLPYYAALAVVLGGGAYGIHQWIQYRREKKVAEEAAKASQGEQTSEEETEEEKKKRLAKQKSKR